MRVGNAILLLGAVALLAAGCGSPTGHSARRNTRTISHKKTTSVKSTTSGNSASRGSQPTGVESSRNPYPSGAPITDPSGLACSSALQASHVSTVSLTDFPSGFLAPNVTTKPTSVTLASSIQTGAVASPGQASGIQTATWNLLSTASGFPLTPHFGQTLTEVALDNPDSLTIGDYVCFESGTKVVGMLAQEPYYNFQPMSDVAVDGRTVSEITGQDYLQWLQSIGAYVPKPVANNPQMSAEDVLLDSFAVLNANESQPSVAQLEAELAPTVGTGNLLAGESSTMVALVPVAVTPYQMPGGNMNPQTYQEFSVLLWPHFRHLTILDFSGNGWIQAFYTVQRSNTPSLWNVTGWGTGP